MSKKNQKFSADNYGNTETGTPPENTFYFGKENYKFMLIGLALIVVGFLLMMGPDANTVDGKYDPNVWNEGFSPSAESESHPCWSSLVSL